MVNVSNRLYIWAMVGFVIEVLASIVSIPAIFANRRNDFCADCCGMIQVIIFMILMSYRYDWYGTVCYGQRLEAGPGGVTPKNEFPTLEKAGNLISLYITIVWGLVGVLLLGVCAYSCCHV